MRGSFFNSQPPQPPQRFNATVLRAERHKKRIVDGEGLCGVEAKRGRYSSSRRLQEQERSKSKAGGMEGSEVLCHLDRRVVS